ncbi:MAG TPA: hypothetical protein PLE86_11005 [Bacteroidales bacterium]|nr:hypothetical protein [Bacteroidales bacterium]
MILIVITSHPVFSIWKLDALMFSRWVGYAQTQRSPEIRVFQEPQL